MPVTVLLRCYAELNDYLSPGERQCDREIPLPGPTTLGALLDRVGIPAAAIEVALVDGESRGLDHLLRGGERVSLYPVFEALDPTPMLRLRQAPLRRVRFVADAHLGRLARYLRLLGFDTVYENDLGDPELAAIAEREGRILLSRDRALLAGAALSHGLWVPSTRPREQVAQVVERLDLYRLLRPFTRCTICNGLLAAVDKAEIAAEVPERVHRVFDAFWRCQGCGRLYWQGSHYQRLRGLVEQIAAARRPE
jgi:uncharacterized protein with PIN domain/sulfur carrier protein ThiS